MQAAVKLFINSLAPGIIVDLRGSDGGLDWLAAYMAGFFYRGQPKFYEAITFFNKNTGQIEPAPRLGPFYVYQNSLTYQGQIVILTNSATISSSEGIPMVLKDQPNVHILSFERNTRGSFGIVVVGGLVKLPGSALGHKPAKNYLVSYPVGRSLDKNGKIQLDSDVHLQGGVATDIKIPMDAATAIEIYTNGKDMGLAYAENCLKNSCWLQ